MNIADLRTRKIRIKRHIIWQQENIAILNMCVPNNRVSKYILYFEHLDKSCSIQFSHSVMSDSLWPHGLQHSKLPCPSSTPRDYSNSSPLRSDAIQTSYPLLLPPSIFPSIRVFSNESVLHIRWSKYGASASVFPMNIQDWFSLGWTGWIFL